MSVQSQIDRIGQNVANTYSVLSALGSDMPAAQTSDNLAATAGSAKAVLYSKQTLTDAQKAQARENISALGADDVGDVLAQAKESGEFDGESGVHVGSSIPSGDQNVWIDPDGAPSGAEVWEFTLADGSIVTKTVVVL